MTTTGRWFAVAAGGAIGLLGGCSTVLGWDDFTAATDGGATTDVTVSSSSSSGHSVVANTSSGNSQVANTTSGNSLVSTSGSSSSAQGIDAGTGAGPTCSGRGPNDAAPSGTFTGSGTLPPAEGAPAVDLSTIIDGYATKSGPSADGGTYTECLSYSLNLVLAPYSHACGYYSTGVDKIGVELPVIMVASGTPFVARSYVTGQVAIGGQYLPDSTPVGKCLGAGGFSEGLGCPPSGTTALTITAIDSSHVAGTLSLDAGNVSGEFDLPFCSVQSGLDPCYLLRSLRAWPVDVDFETTRARTG